MSNRIAPAIGPITSPFGEQRKGYNHHGMDIGWLYANVAGTTRIVAPENGEITHTGRVPGWKLGIVTIIKGDSGAEHWLCHLDHTTKGLGRISQGVQVAVMGDTDAPGQRHLHWEVRYGNDRTDPAIWLAGGNEVFEKSSNINGAPYWPVGELMRRVQRALTNKGRYNGPIDGHGGANTAKGIQLTLKNGANYNGPIDGKLGPVAGKLIQEYAKKWGDYNGPIDGDPRENSWANFALGLERP